MLIVMIEYINFDLRTHLILTAYVYPKLERRSRT